MLLNDILIEIFIKINDPFKLMRVSKQFNTSIRCNKNHIAFRILKRLGFKPSITESYRIYKNFISKHDINNINYDLTGAIKNAYVETVELLLTDPNVDTLVNPPTDAIMVASAYGHANIVKILLADSRIDPSACDNESVIIASMCGHTDIVKLLLADPRVDPSINNEPIIEAASGGHTDIVKLLLKDPRVDPSFNNNYAIRSASRNGYYKIVKLLLKDPRINPSAKNNYAIKWALENGHTKVVRILLADKRTILSTYRL